MSGLPPRLQGAYRAHLVDTTLATLRHELRNKLGAVRNAAFFVRSKLERASAASPERVPEFLEVIDREVQSASDQLESAGSQRAPQEGWSEPAALAPALLDALGLRRATLAVAERGLRVPVPAVDLQVALVCLLENACDALPAAAEGAGCALTITRAGEGVLLRVRDEGLGLAVAPERALEPFFTTQPGRPGLGLAIAQRVARAAGGRLTLAAGPDTGAVAALHLPLLRERL